jgi:hypothetical protein
VHFHHAAEKLQDAQPRRARIATAHITPHKELVSTFGAGCYILLWFD